MPRKSASGSVVLAVLLAGAAGILSWNVFVPAGGSVPAADSSSRQAAPAPASADLHGQGSGSPYVSPAAPTATGIAKAPVTQSPTPATPAASPAPSPGTSFAGFPGSSPVSSGTPSPVSSGTPSFTGFPVPSSAGSGTSLFTTSPVTAPVSSDTSAAAGSGTSAAAGSSTSAAAGSGTSATDAAGLGFYDGDSSPAGIETAASWLGSATSVKYAQDFIDATDWSHISSPWQLPNWQGSPFEMVWGVPMVPCGAPSTQCATNVADYNLVADGGADAYYETLAQNLVAAGFGSSYIRLGWEFNADWMGWGICNEDGSGLASWASDFVPAFQNIVTSMRSVAGANFKFIWNPIDSSNSSCAGANLENFYPGDSYVDAVALDAYDAIGATTTDDARWSDLLNGVNAGDWTAVAPAAIGGQAFSGYGLNWLAAFGKEHGKQVSLPEWGLVSSSSDGGGDDAYYMTEMTDWIKANATGPVILWNYNGGTLALDIPNYTNGDTPDATAVFQSAFAAGI
jgi:hypothetical protein